MSPTASDPGMKSVLEFLREGGTWQWILAFALAAIAFVGAFSADRAFRRYFAVGAGALFIAGLVLCFGNEWSHWVWVLVLIPPSIVIQHAMFLGVVRRQAFTPYQGGGLSPEDMGVVDGVYQHAVQASGRMFAPGALVARYGVPAVIMGAVGIAGASLLLYEPHRAWWPKVGLNNPAHATAALLGLAGAYIYVLLQLATRSYRHDITPGLAMWCAVNLAIGPVFAAALYAIWRPPTTTESGLTGVSIFLLCGLAPRAVASAVEDLLRKSFPGNGAASPRNPLPLGAIQGLSASDEERLREEGIEDASTLAYADPFRLLKATPFDRRRLIDWMDRAHLMSVLPSKWKELEAVGVTGVIDLTWTVGKADDALLAELASKAGLDAAALKKLATRLETDAQVQLLWTLYQVDAGDGSAEANASVRPPLPEPPPAMSVEALLSVGRRGFAATILGAASLGVAMWMRAESAGKPSEWPSLLVTMLAASFFTSALSLLWALASGASDSDEAMGRRKIWSAAATGVLLATLASFAFQAMRYAGDGAFAEALVLGVPAMLILAMTMRSAAVQARATPPRRSMSGGAFQTS